MTDLSRRHYMCTVPEQLRALTVYMCEKMVCFTNPNCVPLSSHAYLLHGADKILSWFANFTPNSGGSRSLVGRVGAVVAAHLHCVAGFSWPTPLVVHDEVHRKHVQTLRRKTGSSITHGQRDWRKSCTSSSITEKRFNHCAVTSLAPW